MSFDIKKFTLGIEEEYMICNPKSGDLVDKASLIMNHFKKPLSDRFSFELIDAVTFTAALLILVIKLEMVSVELTVIVALFPALSTIENLPAVIPTPPFKEERVVSVVIFGLRSVTRIWEPGILKSTFVLSAILTLKVSVFPR